jgi:phage terminase small subunit
VPRARDPNRDRAFEIWRDSGGTAKLKDIADQLGLSEGTVRGGKNKDKWDEQLNGTLQSNERDAPKKMERSKPVKNVPAAVDLEEEDDEHNDSLTSKHRLFVQEYLKILLLTSLTIWSSGERKNLCLTRNGNRRLIQLLGNR